MLSSLAPLPSSARAYLLAKCCWKVLLVFLLLGLGLLLQILRDSSGGELMLFSLVLLFVVLMALLIAAVYSHLLYNSYGFGIGRENLCVQNGVITTENNLIPYSRLQDIIVRRDLIARLLGVSALVMQNANGDSAMLPGLPEDMAEALRIQILANLKNASNASHAVL